MVGVGMTPPKVPGAPKPTSSVMMSNTFGAPFGGTTRGGHQGVDCEALSLITPPNFGSGGGSCFPVIVVVASGEPGAPVICCAVADVVANAKPASNAIAEAILRLPMHVIARIVAMSVLLTTGRSHRALSTLGVKTF
jgi:hypothetical protein